jgi:uncharacterized protein (TIGR02646 family)
VRPIQKSLEPATVRDTRLATTTDLSTSMRAREAFNQVDKGAARKQLAEEQWLCAFCMREVKPEARDERGEATMKIAHRTPVDADPGQALAWRNLLGSCDGGQRSRGRRWCCDAAQGSTPLSIDPTVAGHPARLRYERRAKPGLFVTSDDPDLRHDVEETLALNDGDLPTDRESAWRAFKERQRGHASDPFGKSGGQAYLEKWLARRGSKLPEMLGVLEYQLCLGPWQGRG